MVAEPAHGLRLTRNADARGRVKPLGFDDRKRHVAVEYRVVSPVDALAPTLAEELLDLVSAVGEGHRLVGAWAFV